MGNYPLPDDFPFHTTDVSTVFRWLQVQQHPVYFNSIEKRHGFRVSLNQSTDVTGVYRWVISCGESLHHPCVSSFEHKLGLSLIRVLHICHPGTCILGELKFMCVEDRDIEWISTDIILRSLTIAVERRVPLVLSFNHHLETIQLSRPNRTWRTLELGVEDGQLIEVVLELREAAGSHPY